ncbi:PREDICTED: tripartite motif-containing protein 3-like [Branchiostoma belcheri]|uniref:RING-type E3 ubiquitin transferase n=1 Tax=Branchiostoma belcheri TaxID=7741 RepID=A0A6P4YB77_BRABE|nr:PREDICTED: tripartite motif-containing protein 3-like [Branchiostoma belcheri]
MGNEVAKPTEEETDLQTEELLTCGICLEDFKTPKLLPCGHTFCQACLERYVRGAPDMTCPVCRRQVAIPPEGVGALPGNFWVGNVRELLKGQRRERKANVRETRRLCAAHSDAEFRCFCKDCSQSVCAECIVESHRDHDVSSLREVTEEKCEEAGELQRRARRRVEQVVGKLQSFDESRIDCEKKEETLEKKIVAAKEEVIKRAEQSAASLISQARTIYKKRVGQLDEGAQTLESYLAAMLKGLDDLGGAVKDGDVPELDVKMQALSEVLERGVDTTTQVPVCPQVEFVAQKLAVHLGTVQVKDQEDGAKGEAIGEVDRRLKVKPALPPKKIAPRKYGSKGQFECPIRATVANDKVYILDKALGGRVQAFGLQDGDVVSSFVLGFSSGLSLRSGGLLVEPSGDVYVPCSVSGAKRANVLWSHSKKPTKVVLNIGSEDDPISDAAFSPEGRIVLALKGKICTIDKTGLELSEFSIHSPSVTNICVYKSAILLSLFAEKKVQVYKPSGELRHEFGSDAHFSAPCGLAVDLQGKVLVTDGPNGRVSVFDGRKDGAFLRHIAGREDGLGYPRDVACTQDGRAVVVDSQHNCVFILNY